MARKLTTRDDLMTALGAVERRRVAQSTQLVDAALKANAAKLAAQKAAAGQGQAGNG